MRLLAILLLGAIPTIAQQGFYPFTIDQDRLSGAPDFSFLNHPLTASDRLFVRDGHFYRVGDDLRPGTADDRRVRLFGVNMAFGANFPEAEDAPRIAKRLRRLGVNLVRCHHMDSNPDRDPQTANSLLTREPYPALNPVSVERLRHFLDALKAEGIYANLNLHVGYQFRPEIDRVPPTPGIDFPSQSKPLHVFFPRMVELQAVYARKVIEALKLKNDPVLAMVEIDNETSMLQAWQTGSLDRSAVGEYRIELEKQWHQFSPEGGPLVASKDSAANPKTADYLLFLTDRDHAYMKRMLAVIRETTDRLVPVTGTQMGYGGLLNLDSQADLDFQDNHFYIDHYNFPHAAWAARDWRIRDSSAVGSGLAAYLNMAATRRAGQPYTVSEFNEPWPNRHAAEIDPTLAVFGAFQDWDAIVHFAYAHARNWDNQGVEGFNINADWTKYPNIGQSAWLFRSGAIEAAKVSVEIGVTREMQLDAGRKRAGGNVSNFLAGAAGFDPSIALVHAVGLKGGASGLPAPAGAPPYRSDTGELTYDSAKKVYTIAAREAAGAFGFLGKDKVAAGAIEVQLGASAGEFASILVTALDGKALADSARLLISTPGYTLGTVRASDPPRLQKVARYPGTTDWWTLEPEAAGADPSDARAGLPPVWMERVESTITLHSTARSVIVYPLDGAGARLEALPATAVKPLHRRLHHPLAGRRPAIRPLVRGCAIAFYLRRGPPKLRPGLLGADGRYGVGAGR
jgi:hypothetical protein